MIAEEAQRLYYNIYMTLDDCHKSLIISDNPRPRHWDKIDPKVETYSHALKDRLITFTITRKNTEMQSVIRNPGMESMEHDAFAMNFTSELSSFRCCYIVLCSLKPWP